MGSSQFQGLDVGRKDCWMIFPEDLTLVTDKSSPFYDPRVELPVSEELVENILMNGVIQPITVKKDGSEIVVIYGRQRVKAAIEANKRRRNDKIRVPCITQRGEDIDLFGGMISENELRQDDDPMRKAEKCAKYINAGKTEAEAAVMFGVKQSTVKQWMKMLDLSAPVRNAVKSGKIAPSAAAKLSSLSTEDQKKALDEATAGVKPTTKGAAALARSLRSKSGSRPKSIRRKDEVEAMLTTYKGTVFEPFLKWFLGEDVALPATTLISDRL